MKNVQIPLTLFLELYGYVVLGEYQFHDDIVRQLEDKHVNVNTHMYKKWNILMYNNGITHLLRESPEAHACL